MIVSALVEQKAEDPYELCSKLADFVPTVMRDNIFDALETEWYRPSPFSSCSGSPSPPKKMCTSES